jgi:hypothetical protein
MSEPAEDLGPVIDELRRPVEVRAASIAAVKAAVAHAERRWPRRAWRWLREPRPVRLAPLHGLAALALAGLLLVLGASLHSPTPRLPDGRTATAPAGTQPVRFALVAHGARKVSLVGDFNDWNPHSTPLRTTGSGGGWTVTVPLPPGRYTYAFVVDGVTWTPDPVAPPAPGEDFGQPNSLLLVGESRT